MTAEVDPDTIEAYLAAGPVHKADIDAAGGYLAYWEQAKGARPRLSRMALDFLTAPGMYLCILYTHMF